MAVKTIPKIIIYTFGSALELQTAVNAFLAGATYASITSMSFWTAPTSGALTTVFHHYCAIYYVANI